MAEPVPPRRTHRQVSLEGHLEAFAEGFRPGRDILEFFRTGSASVIWAKQVPPFVRGPSGSWYLLVRLDQAMELRLGFTREFLVYCMPVPDLQSRAVQQAQALLQHLLRVEQKPVDNAVVAIYSNDYMAGAKVAEWTDLPLTVIALSPVQVGDRIRDRRPLEDVLRPWLHTRNLYDYRDPVSGDQFFGRQDVLQQLLNACGEGRHTGLWGLRKIGKTSILNQLQRRLIVTEDVLSVRLDLQTSSGSGSAGHVAHRIAGEIGAILHRAPWARLTKDVVRDEWFGLPRRWERDHPERAIQALCDGLSDLFSAVLNDRRLVLILDEFEVVWSAEHVLVGTLDLLRGLRGIAQETERLTLILAGVNAQPSEAGVLQGRDNPIFGFLSPLYLGPFQPDEVRSLIANVGQRMGLVWPAASVDPLVHAAGGHPFLTRLAAAQVAERYRDCPKPKKVDESHVVKILHELPRTHHADLKQVMLGLSLYYPDEVEVLKLLLEAGHGAEHRDFPTALSHLAAYGLIDETTLQMRVPLLERWIREYGGSDL